jgi:hypothetical protein
VLVESEFVADPAILIACCDVGPGEHASAVVERARRELVAAT